MNQVARPNQAWLMSIDNPEMSPEKVVKFCRYVGKIYLHEAKDDSNCVPVKKLQASNVIPGLCLETRKKYTKEQQCKYFLKVISQNSFFINVMRFSVWFPMTFLSCRMMSPL